MSAAETKTPPAPASTAVAIRTPDRITTAEQFSNAVAEWQGKCHVLTPFASVGSIAPMHAVWVSVVQINPDKASGEVYYSDSNAKLPWLKDGEVALAKNGLRKIAEGLGVDIKLHHLSVGVKPHYWLVRAVATYKSLDGSIVTREASMEWDLRDGSDRLKGFTANQITEARKHGLRNCETRAINAAIRECGCGVKQAYKREELAKPFVALRCMYTPDYADPETRRLLTERALTGTSALYAQTAPAAPVIRGAFDDVIDDVPQQGRTTAPQTVGRGSTPAAAGQSSQAPAGADQPPVPGAVRIAKVTEKKGETNGNKWTRYTIVDHTGESYSTFSETLAEAANKARAKAEWVELGTETKGDYVNLVELAPAGQQPTLPNVDNL